MSYRTPLRKSRHFKTTESHEPADAAARAPSPSSVRLRNSDRVHHVCTPWCASRPHIYTHMEAHDVRCNPLSTVDSSPSTDATALVTGPQWSLYVAGMKHVPARHHPSNLLRSSHIHLDTGASFKCNLPTGTVRRNALDSCSGDAQFESRPPHRHSSKILG